MPDKEPLERRDPLRRAEDFDLALEENDTARAIQRLDWFGQHGVLLLKIMAVLVALQLAVGGIAVAAAIGARHAVGQAASAKEQADLARQVAALARQGVLNNCEASNDSRRSDRELWEFILQLAPASRPGDEDREVRFRQFLDKHLAERDCDAIADSAPTTTLPQGGAR